MKVGVRKLYCLFICDHCMTTICPGPDSIWVSANDTKTIASIIEPQNVGPLELLFDPDM